ncbi:MAG TPA: hypothetical protein VMB50_17265, partial [Myxococcales bacterium]|nr:hypothetical protein [Myxococcales bacterium]
KVGTREDQAWLTDLFWRQRLVAPGAAVAALRALRDLGQLDEAILRAAAEGADPDLAREGLQAAAAQGSWDVIHGHVAHPRWEVRCEVAAALRQEGGPSAVASLQGMLAREQVPLAAEEERAALEALGARSGP